MSIDTNKDEITVNDVTYHVEREPDRGGSGEETLTIKEFSVEEDDWVFPFDGLQGTLGYEESGEGLSPRDWSNVGTMAVSYNGYNLGDEDISKIDFEVECPRCVGDGFLDDPVAGTDGTDCPDCEATGNIDVNPVDYFKRQGARVVMGLTVYEHSGITMYAGDVTVPFDSARWDTSFVGFIYDTPEGVKQCMGDDVSDEEIKAALEGEVKVYASYLEGDLTWYSVEDDETNYHDACGGFVGDHKYCEEQCFEALEGAIVKRLAENKERAEWNARDVTTQ